jgi:hypothetical protein
VQDASAADINVGGFDPSALARINKKKGGSAIETAYENKPQFIQPAGAWLKKTASTTGPNINY